MLACDALPLCVVQRLRDHLTPNPRPARASRALIKALTAPDTQAPSRPTTGPGKRARTKPVIAPGHRPRGRPPKKQAVNEVPRATRTRQRRPAATPVDEACEDADDDFVEADDKEPTPSASAISSAEESEDDGEETSEPDE